MWNEALQLVNKSCQKLNLFEFYHFELIGSHETNIKIYTQKKRHKMRKKNKLYFVTIQSLLKTTMALTNFLSFQTFNHKSSSYSFFSAKSVFNTIEVRN